MSRNALVGLLLGLSTCTPSKPTAPSVPSVQPAAPAPPPAPVTPPVATPTAPAPPPFAIHAPPGGVITHVGVTPAADAAITLDDAREVRLYPTLDGTQPPVVVDLPMGKDLALVHDGAGFAVAERVDGAMIIARVAADGRITSHVERAAVTGVVGVGAAFVAWQGQTLEVIAPDGTTRETLDTHAAVRAVVATPDGAVITVAGATKVLTSGPLALGAAAKAPAPVVTAAKSDLVIATAAGPRYLGYAFPANVGDTRPVIGDADHIVYRSGDRWLRLDHALASLGEVTPWVPRGDHAHELRWRSGDDWFVRADAGILVDQLAAGTGHLALANAWIDAYEPSSQLALLALDGLARYQPATGILERLPYKTVHGPMARTALVPDVQPGGPLLYEGVRSYAPHDHLTMTWVRDLDHPDVGKKQLVFDDVWEVHFGAHDQIAALGGRRADQPDPSGVYFDGVRTGDGAPTYDNRMPGGATLELPPSNDTQSVRLVDALQHELWVRPYEFNGLFAVGRTLFYIPRSGGVATVDLATGDLVSASAGWGFELAAAPHVASAVGRPIARELAIGRELVQLGDDVVFQELARAVAKASDLKLLAWGPFVLGGKPTRAALLKRVGETGMGLYAYLVETSPGEARAIAITAWGASRFQGIDDPPREPPWGVAIDPEQGLQGTRTIDQHGLEIGTRWIHGSQETAVIELARGEPIVASDRWNEHENTGHGMDSTSGGNGDRHPKVGAYKFHAMTMKASKPSRRAAELAATIVESPPEP
ncbi:MAG: hypothetical protein NT062_32405 [Proteobacteria bacterium]|nr:hypothetical protein [Pseudomonadota bacterium]